MRRFLAFGSAGTSWAAEWQPRCDTYRTHAAFHGLTKALRSSSSRAREPARTRVEDDARLEDDAHLYRHADGTGGRGTAGPWPVVGGVEVRVEVMRRPGTCGLVAYLTAMSAR
jgi:hypothetical protein